MVKLISMNLKYIILSITIFLSPHSYSYEKKSSIIEGARDFIKQQIKYQYKNVDLKSLSIKILDYKLINDKVCTKKISYSFPSYSSINKKATIVADCQAANGWKIYIPVNIQFFANALSAKKPLPKYHIINKDDLVRQKINVLQLKEQYYTDPKDVVGLTLKSAVKQNTVLTSGLLKDSTYGT